MSIVKSREMEQAHELWQKGQTLDAGRIIFESIPPKSRPQWAARILSLVSDRCGIPTPEIDRAIEVANDPNEWCKGHDAFDDLRDRTLELQKLPARTEEQRLLLKNILLAELVAKVTYNATNPADEFDEDSGWWIPRLVKGILDLLQDDEFSESMWSALCFEEV